ncbi:hypothetical protein A3D78_01175 [Candidatus Gottesmanbacteria bacterium RIFCSPHIGHO2_02_FULL_39_14]|uniref:Polysaccharide pyruvyl transferase domain-containing protein n=1 Tax=Candidatus Gottesmanbacteria bacterium RIFCSPHIGHO2_02_FULL_39_14 TaxID=1798383 RepID=A0A1F5ZTY3_9BACT|nr:MAG: hypothetical protein A3D78_01175 [Candidatus Gottesmanbacteria bacterium RIFCSPHIGHO2_02_FULL_39_14]
MWPVLFNLYKSLKIKYKLRRVIDKNNLSNHKAAGTKLIIFGPWLGEVGSELQYWIPFIRKIKRQLYPDARIIVISRGGVESWYQDITKDYIELFDHLTVPQYTKLRNSVVKVTGLEKQLIMSPAEKKLIKYILEKKNCPDCLLIHPSSMWKEILPWAEGKISLNDVLSLLSFNKIPVLEKYKNLTDKLNLPKTFFVMKFYESSLFPKTENNILFIKNLTNYLTQKSNVVNMNNSSVDNHLPIKFSPGKKIISVSNLTPDINLGVQTEIIRRSIGFFGTNGGFDILPAFVGKSSLSFYSTPLTRFMPAYFQHEMIARKLYEYLGVNSYSIMSTDSWRSFFN